MKVRKNRETRHPDDGIIGVVGGGAAGFFSAIHNKTQTPHCRVIIFEKNAQVLSKVKISGGGRCNVTHACFEPRQLTQFYPRGGQELLGPFHRFNPKDTMDWFEKRGVRLKIEADNRVFPVSDSSREIMDCLINTALTVGVEIWTSCEVTAMSPNAEGFSVTVLNGNTYNCKKLVLATGSSRPVYDFAKRLGHSIQPPIPSLFTFKIADEQLHQLSGCSAGYVRVHLEGCPKHYQEGPLLITHWGVSGPAIIKLSAFMAKELFDRAYQSKLFINWLPEYSLERIQEALTDFSGIHPLKNIGRVSPFKMISHRLWGYLIEKSVVEHSRQWSQLRPKEGQVLAKALGHSEFLCVGKGQFKEEFVTCGGVCLKEINFKTMESKRCKGLHIVGELLDIDGVTGGFNFQNAWTTGYLSSLSS